MRWPRGWGLPSLIVLLAATSVKANLGIARPRTTTTLPEVAGLDFTSFPATVTSSELGGPDGDLFPFTIEGYFRIDYVGASGPIVYLTSALYGNVDSFPGIALYVSSSGTLYFEVSSGGTEAPAQSRSQQRTLNDDRSRRHHFLAVATEEHVQVVVDGLMGARGTGGCTRGSSDCNMLKTWAWTVGQNPADRSASFIGVIEDLKLRRMRDSEKPRPTVMDSVPDANVPPASSEFDEGNADAVLILIPVLIVALVGLVWAGVMLWCCRKQPSQTTVVSPVLPPGSVGSCTSPQAALAAPAPAAAAPASAPAPATVGALQARTSETRISRASPPVEVELPIEPPEWWSTSAKRPPSSKQELELVETSEETRMAVQELMNSTWRGSITRDRTALGNGWTVKHFEVVQVSRNENFKIWQDYARRRREIGRAMVEDDLLDSVLTEGAPADLGERKVGCNEYLLFHGSKPGAVGSICENDFLLNLAGSHRGTLYGKGIYFAESSSKADEYAEDDKGGVYRGLYAMLLCRVTLGKSYYTDAVRPEGKALQKSCTGPEAQYDSVLGDREKARGTYREFVVYNGSQAYPEYVIIYRRKDVPKKQDV